MRAATEISELESPAGAKRFLERQMMRLPASEAERLKKHPKLESLWRENGQPRQEVSAPSPDGRNVRRRR
jgi:hypothetical protein